MKRIVFLFFICIFLISCSKPQGEPIPLKILNDQKTTDIVPEENTIKVAFASVVSPQQTRIKYNLLIDYLEEKLDRPFHIIQRQTYDEVNQMIKAGEVDLAFICSLSYVIGNEQKYLEGIVVPQINGGDIYRSYIITHKNSDMEKFEDLEGKRFAFVDPYSYSGRLAVLDLLDRRGLSIDFFDEVFYTYSHDYSISAVSRGTVDAACVDSLLFDTLVTLENEDVKNVKIIEYGAYTGISPIVVSNQIDPIIKEEIKQTLLTLNESLDGSAILQELGIDRYIPVDEKKYTPTKNLLHLLGDR